MVNINLSNLLSMTDFWSTIINFFVNAVTNYGWAIILFTICLKLVLSPLDYLQRKSTKKNAKIQALAQPEIAKVAEKYPNDKNKQSQAQMEIYKKYNYNVMGTCVFMLVYMALTLFIFITMFNGLNSISASTLVGQYDRLEAVYETGGEEAVIDEYEIMQSENSWLWVKNVFRGDTAESVLMSFDEYYVEAGLDLTDEEKANLEIKYNQIEEIVYSIDGQDGWNGYYILIVLAGAVAFISQWVMTKMMQGGKKPAEGDVTASTNKIMMIVLPIMLMVFAYQSSAIFALYLITNSLISMIISYLSNIIQRKSEDKQEGKKDKKVVKVEYSRDYFKG